MGRDRTKIKFLAFVAGMSARAGKISAEDVRILRAAVADLEPADQLRVEVDSFCGPHGTPGPEAGLMLCEAIDHLNAIEIGDGIRRITGD